MATKIDTPSPAEAVGSHTLKEEVKKLLGDKTSVKVGTGVVSQVGFEFTEANKTETAWVTSLTSPEAIATALIARGIVNMREAYKAVDERGREVFISKYHTQRTFGKAPALKLDDLVDIYAVANPKSESKFAFAYQPVRHA